MANKKMKNMFSFNKIFECPIYNRIHTNQSKFVDNIISINNIRSNIRFPLEDYFLQFNNVFLLMSYEYDSVKTEDGARFVHISERTKNKLKS